MTHALPLIGIAAYEVALVGLSFALAALGYCPAVATWDTSLFMQVGAIVAVVAMVVVVSAGLVSVLRSERRS